MSIASERIEAFNDLKNEELAFTGSLVKTSLGVYNTSTGLATPTSVSTSCALTYLPLKASRQAYEINEKEFIIQFATLGVVPVPKDKITGITRGSITKPDLKIIRQINDIGAGIGALFQAIVT